MSRLLTEIADYDTPGSWGHASEGWGEFLDRRQALTHARWCGQILDESAVRGKELFSEDLW